MRPSAGPAFTVPELRRTLLAEGALTFRIVLACKTAANQRVCGRHISFGFGQRQFAQGALYGLHGERRVLRHIADVGLGPCREFLARPGQVDEAVAHGVVRIEDPGAQEQVGDAGHADAPHEARDIARLVAETQSRRRYAEAGIVRREPQVAAHGEGKAAAEADALDQRHRWLGRIGESLVGLLDRRTIGSHRGLARAALAEFRDVRASAEGALARTRYGDHADSGILVGLSQLDGQVAPHVERHRVHAGGLAQGDDGDAIPGLVTNVRTVFDHR